MKLCIIAIVGYLLGSFSISVLISKYLLRDDVREHGSGNAGATNVARTFGMRAGLLTLAGDMLKTCLSGLFGLWLAGELGLVIGCGACLIGHCWPVFFQFRGGKGVSVSACIALMIDYRLFLILLCIFLLVFLISHRVSACSVTAAVCYPIVYWLLNPGLSQKLVLCLLVFALVINLHRQNIQRLLHGQEPEFRLNHRKEAKG